MVRVTSLFIVAASAPGFSFGVSTLTEIKIRCVEGMHMLKVWSDLQWQKKCPFSLANVSDIQGILNLSWHWEVLEILQARETTVSN